MKRLSSLSTLVYTLAAGLLLAVLLISLLADIPVENFTRDPAAVYLSSPFVGVVSSLGILFWSFTVAICFYGAALLARRGRRESGRFLFFAGSLTLFLLLDDFFMFHELVFPKYLHIPEKAVYLGYILLAALFFLRFLGLILMTELRLLAAACVLFALSIGSDALLRQQGMEFFVEDSFKLLGIVSWFLYFTRTSMEQVRGLMEDAGARTCAEPWKATPDAAFPEWTEAPVGEQELKAPPRPEETQDPEKNPLPRIPVKT